VLKKHQLRCCDKTIFKGSQVFLLAIRKTSQTTFKFWLSTVFHDRNRSKSILKILPINPVSPQYSSQLIPVKIETLDIEVTYMQVSL